MMTMMVQIMNRRQIERVRRIPTFHIYINTNFNYFKQMILLMTIIYLS
jgi:hypothetical protein